MAVEFKSGLGYIGEFKDSLAIAGDPVAKIKIKPKDSNK